MSCEAALPEPPLQRFYDLGDLSDAGDEVVIAAQPDDLPRLADWFDVASVEAFKAVVTLTRQSAHRFVYEAVLDADLTQSCVVSLEPVASHHHRDIVRVLNLKPRHGRHRAPVEEAGGVLTISAGDDEVPEELDTPRYDLAIPLLEDLSLGIDPYPRAEGVELEIPAEHRPQKDSPFAALKRLKEGGS